MVVSPRCLERGSSLRLRHTINVRDDRPPSKQAARSAPPNAAVASAACLEGRPGPVTPSTTHTATCNRHCERSEAIHSLALQKRKLDCFVASLLAMTANTRLRIPAALIARVVHGSFAP